MSDLKDQMKEFVAFNSVRCYKLFWDCVAKHHAEKKHKDAGERAVEIAKAEHTRLSPLLDLLQEIVECLEFYALYMSGKKLEFDSSGLLKYPSPDVAEQTLAKIKEAVEGNLK